MIYEILMDGQTLYYPGDEQCVVLDPKITLKMNDAGRCELSIPKINPLYDSVKLGKSTITVKKDGKEVFYGEVKAYDRNFDMSKKIVALGALSFLSRSIQPSHNYGNIPHATFLSQILAIHNAQMFDDNSRKIQLGYVTVPNTSNLVDKITDKETTLEAIRNNLIEPHGGVLRLRHVNGNLYLDYVTLAEYGTFCTQKIALGDNLLDYTEDFSAENVVTVVEPYGARLEDQEDSEFEKRVDITSVNGGNNYLLGNSTAIANYGYNRAKIVYDGITSPSELKTMGQTYLRETQFERAVFKLTAADLAATDVNIDAICFGDRIKVEVPLVGLDATYPIVEMTMTPLKPEDEKIVLSANLRTKKVTLTGRTNAASREAVAIAQKEALKIKQVIAGEIANIMASFAGEYGGYKLSEFDENGLWLRDLYMDAPDKEDATNIMEFSMRGIRFSNAGYKSPTDSAWKLAMTIDGKFASQEIFSNIIFANLIKAGIIQDVNGKMSWNLETGLIRSVYGDKYMEIQNGELRVGLIKNGVDTQIGSIKITTRNAGANQVPEIRINSDGYIILNAGRDIELDSHSKGVASATQFGFLTEPWNTYSADTIALPLSFNSDGTVKDYRLLTIKNGIISRK